jgi:ATP-binding cassette, subfamily C (CFTR/MRP), member 1
MWHHRDNFVGWIQRHVVGETVQGLTSIRAYNVQQRFIDISDRLLDKNQSCYFASCVSNR